MTLFRGIVTSALIIQVTYANLLTGASAGGTNISSNSYPSYGIDGDIHVYEWNSTNIWNIYHSSNV